MRTTVLLMVFGACSLVTLLLVVRSRRPALRDGGRGSEGDAFVPAPHDASDSPSDCGDGGSDGGCDGGGGSD